MRDHDDHRDGTGQQGLVRRIQRRRGADDLEMAGSRQVAGEAPRGARAIEIDDVDRGVANLERRGVRQDQQLDDRDDQDLRHQNAVAHDVQDLGLCQEQDAAHRYSSRSLNECTLAASSTAAITARISVSCQR